MDKNLVSTNFLEAIIVKIFSIQFAYESLKLFQVVPNYKQMTSAIPDYALDVINSLGSFLDSSVSNRMFLAAYGLRSGGSWYYDHIAKMRLNQVYFFHFMKNTMFTKKDTLQRYKGSLDGFQELKKVHPLLTESSKLLKKSLEVNLEIVEHLLVNYGKNCIHYQLDMNRFASIVMNIYQMVSVISRANHSLEHNSPYSQQEYAVCKQICNKLANQVHLNEKLIYGVIDTSDDKISKAIHKRNIQFNGYFAMPTFDRII